jgi:hypothetical protein
MAFVGGLAAFENVIREGKERSGGSFGPRLNYYSWKDGDVKIVRFLTDEPIVGNFAEWVITNDGKSADFLLDPDGTNWVEHFGGKSRERGTSGQLITPKVSKRGVGVAVLRAERPKAGGGTEIIDHTSSFEAKDGKTYQSRYFGIVKLSIGNFWEQLIGISKRNGTICDRDFEIRRVGADLHTKYEISPIDPIEELRDPEVVRQFYGYGRPHNAEDADRFLYCPMTLPEWCDYYSGEERARRLLVPKNGGPVATQPADFSRYASPPITVTAAANGVGGNDTVRPNTSNPGGPWAGAEDEAQAVPSSTSSFADLRSKLMPHLDK